MDEEAKQLRVRAADLEDEAEKLITNNNELITERDRLKDDLQEKLLLLEQFEVRFEAQFKYFNSHTTFVDSCTLLFPVSTGTNIQITHHLHNAKKRHNCQGLPPTSLSKSVNMCSCLPASNVTSDSIEVVTPFALLFSGSFIW